MARRSEFVAYIVELLAPLGAIRAKAMFGGWGLYCDEQFCAIIIGDVLYLKADDETREQFVAAGQHPFTFVMRGAEQRMDYYTVPVAALDDFDELQPWARLALAAARRKSARTAQRQARRGRTQ
jgi:DNA transformation protein